MIVALRPFLRTARQCELETSRPVPNLATFSLSNLEPLLTPFPATHPQNPPVTPFAATHTNSPSCKSFPCHTYKKQGGVPLWECGGLAAAFTAANLAPQISHVGEARYHITSFFLLHKSHSIQELLKWIPPSSPAPETPSTPPNSANSLSPTVASAACSVTSPTRLSASSTPAKSSNSSPRKKSARNSYPSPDNSAPPPTSTMCS